MLWHGWRIAATQNQRLYFTVRAVVGSLPLIVSLIAPIRGGARAAVTHSRNVNSKLELDPGINCIASQDDSWQSWQSEVGRSVGCVPACYVAAAGRCQWEFDALAPFMESVTNSNRNAVVAGRTWAEVSNDHYIIPISGSALVWQVVSWSDAVEEKPFNILQVPKLNPSTKRFMEQRVLNF